MEMNPALKQYGSFAAASEEGAKMCIRDSTYTYARYQNTGELSRNLKQVKKGDKVVVDAGTRAKYTSGYHGMYFLVEKKGMEDVKTTLKKGANYANCLLYTSPGRAPPRAAKRHFLPQNRAKSRQISQNRARSR